MSFRRSLDLGFNIHMGWGARSETPDDLALRWMTAIDRFALIHPLFKAWWDWTDLSNIEPMSRNRSDVAARIAAGVSCDDDGKPLRGIDKGKVVDVFQYPIRAANHPPEVDLGPRGVMLNAWAGSGPGIGWNNIIHFDIGWCVDPDPELSSYSMVHAIISVLVEVFEVDYGSAFPAGLSRFPPMRAGQDPALLDLAWFSYIAPRFTHLVVPPSSALVEWIRNGGLLMSASLENFDPHNTAHRAIATEIATAASHLRLSSIGL